MVSVAGMKRCSVAAGLTLSIISHECLLKTCCLAADIGVVVVVWLVIVVRSALYAISV